MHVVDLTHVHAPGIPVYPGGTQPTIETLGTIEKDGYFIQRFTTGEHTGTHVDAPAHFAAGATTVDAIPAETLVGPAAVIDVTAAVASNPDYAVTVADLKAWETRNGALTARHLVLVRTGWGARWADQARYLDSDDKGVMHFPGVSLEASHYLVDKGVRCVGIDTLSTDPGPSSTFDEHRYFHGAGGYHVENLANLEKLPEAGATVIVAPLPLGGGSGAPARVLALVP